MLLIDQRFCMTPPYSTTSPGTLMSPTSVAAVSCQALSPGLSQCGYAAHMCCRFLLGCSAAAAHGDSPSPPAVGASTMPEPPADPYVRLSKGRPAEFSKVSK